jgi:hypothetical protein
MNTEQLRYSFRGQMLTKAEIEALTTKRKPKPKPDGPGAYHRGYRIVGHKPGGVQAAKEDADFAVQKWINTAPGDRIRLGMRQPKVWDEIWWRNNGPKTTIKTVDIARAADEAADLARRYGWTEVEIVALTKGERPEGWA